MFVLQYVVEIFLLQRFCCLIRFVHKHISVLGDASSMFHANFGIFYSNSKQSIFCGTIAYISRFVYLISEIYYAKSSMGTLRPGFEARRGVRVS
jgi:hypothetical protein